MFGINGIMLPASYESSLGAVASLLSIAGVQFGEPKFFYGLAQFGFFVALLLVVWFAPNSQTWIGYAGVEAVEEISQMKRPALRWQASAVWGIALGVVAAACINMMSRAGEFLYFQF